MFSVLERVAVSDEYAAAAHCVGEALPFQLCVGLLYSVRICGVLHSKGADRGELFAGPGNIHQYELFDGLDDLFVDRPSITPIDKVHSV